MQAVNPFSQANAIASGSNKRGNLTCVLSLFVNKCLVKTGVVSLLSAIRVIPLFISCDVISDREREREHDDYFNAVKIHPTIAEKPTNKRRFGISFAERLSRHPFNKLRHAAAMKHLRRYLTSCAGTTCRARREFVVSKLQYFLSFEYIQI